MKIKVGDTFWYAPARPRDGGAREVRVEKVGRKYIHFAEAMVPRAHMRDGHIFPECSFDGEFYESEKEFKRHREGSRLLTALRERTYSLRHGVTPDDVIAAAKLLRVELPDIKA